MRRWLCTYLLDDANGHKQMTVAALDMRQAMRVFEHELQRESVIYPTALDVRSLTELKIEEVA